MKYLFILPLAILLFMSCNNSKKTTQTSDKNQADTITTENIEVLPTFQIYGESLPVGYLDDENPITEKYGFRMKRIAGCTLGSDEAKKAKQNNAQLMKKMNEEYGVDWRAVFEKETGFKLAIPY
mgnify:CR=1 FL=1